MAVLKLFRRPDVQEKDASFGQKLHNITANGTAKWTGELSFLNTWKYQLGAEILVARGRQELFDSGVLFYYNYGEFEQCQLSRCTGSAKSRSAALMC